MKIVEQAISSTVDNPEKDTLASADGNATENDVDALAALGAVDDVGGAAWSLMRQYAFGLGADTVVRRIADLWKRGVKAIPYLRWRDVGGRREYRAYVRLPDGTIEEGVPEPCVLPEVR